jgi:hypothetical protein
LRRSVSPAAVPELIDQLIRGVMSQLYNLPVDMIIERRIATRLRAASVKSSVSGG